MPGVCVVFVCISVDLWFRSDVLLLGQREGSDCLLGSLLFGYTRVLSIIAWLKTQSKEPPK